MSNSSRFYGIARLGHDERNILILSPYIQTKQNAKSSDIDFSHSLIADLDSISAAIAEQIKDMINSSESSMYTLLIEFLSQKTLTNNEFVLNWLQRADVIKKIPASDARLLPILGGTPLSELNVMIKRQMMEREGASISVEEHHRRMAEQYNEELSKSDTELAVEAASKQPLNESANTTNPYPDFGNPSERGDVRLSEPDPTILSQLDTDLGSNHERSDNIHHAEDRIDTGDANQEEQFDPSSLKDIHGDILGEIDKTNKLVSEAMEVVGNLDDALSSKVVGRLMTRMKNYGSTSREGVKEVLIDLLAEHYDNVDAEYIRRNLKVADARLKKSKD